MNMITALVSLRYDGIYLVKFWIAEGEALAISIPRGEAAAIRHFQAKIPLIWSFPT
jgi:hypothetical protein